MKKDTEQQYSIRWEIDIWATSPEQAAFKALTIMQDEDSRASFFSVTAPPKRGVPTPESTIDLEQYAVCFSCGELVFLGDEPFRYAEIKDMNQRINAGGMVPSCECPKCGCLAYPALKMIK